MKVLYPIVVCFMGLQKLVSRKKGEQVTMTEEELESIIDTMVQEGEIDDQDAELMHGMIESNYRTVYDIMVPRVDMVAIKLGMSIEEIKEIFFKYKFSRVPVYKEDKDNIIGILSERDFFKALIEHKKIDITKMVSAPLYVSLSMKSDDLIRKMQKEKKHFAVVTDEYGGTDGIVH
jgi:CBS domain containing-hemolysin-like protein